MPKFSLLLPWRKAESVAPSPPRRSIIDVAQMYKLPLHQFPEFLLRMAGKDHTSGAELETLLQAHPTFATDPLQAYVHSYANGNANAPAPERKTLFLHFQQSGGETIAHLMRANARNVAFRRDFARLPNLPPRFILECFHDLAAPAKERERDLWDRYDTFAEHLIYGTHEMLRSPYRYITLLRHPIDRLLAYGREVHKARQNDKPFSILQLLSEHDFRREYMQGQSIVQILSGYPHTGYELRLRSHSVTELAKEHLYSCELVLIAEHMEQSIKLLCSSSHWQDAFLEGEKLVPRAGRFMESMRIGEWHSLTRQELDAATEFLQEDMDLYELGLSLFQDSLSRSLSGKSSMTPAHMITSPEPVPPAETEVYRTSVGPLHMSNRWAHLAWQEGIRDPLALDQMARFYFYTKHQEGLDLIHAILKRWYVSREVPRQWIESLHAEHICNEVIELDSYGLRTLKAEGFDPKVIVDIGGHIGTFSLLAHSLWPDAQIFVIEPLSDDNLDPNNFHMLERNVRGVSNVTLINRALLGYIGRDTHPEYQQDLEQDDHEHWVELGFRGHPEHAEKVIRYGMTAISVRSLLEEFSIDSIDLLKMDCEGAETNVLREWKELNRLHSIPIILGEWHAKLARREVPRLLEETHSVHMTAIPPFEHSGLFHARRLTALTTGAQ